MSLDNELDAAYGPAAPSADAPPSDSELDAAYGSAADIKTAAAEKSKNPYDPNRTAFGDPIEQGLHEMGSGLYHNIVGGYKGLYTLAATRDASKAAQAVTEETSKAYQQPAEDEDANLPPEMRTPAMRKAREQLHMAPATELGDIAERHGAPPWLSTAAAVFPTALSTMAGARGLGPEAPKLTPAGAPETAQAVVNKASGAQSMGAAGVPVDVSAISPEGQAAVAKTDANNLNTAALQNHMEAEKHGVQLTEGQARADPEIYSREQNSTHPDIVKRINAQEGQMTDALDTIRREASPSTVHNDVIQNGQTAVDSLKAYDEPVQADIRAKYKALEQANGGSLPIDAGTFVSDVDAVLKKKFLTGSVPTAAKEFLDSMRAGDPLDFERFEDARSRLAEAQRNGGSEGTAAKLIRGKLEQMPLAPEAAKLKGLADTARDAARTRFEALEADPAYQAAVDDVAGGVKKSAPSPLADKFLDHYALNAPKANLDTMMAKLDEGGKGAVASHTLNAVRKGAINSNGKVLPKGYNDAMQKYGPKLDSLIAPETKEGLESLGRVITKAKVAPPGHSVNYSKSGVIINAAKGIGETALNAKTLGMGVPFVKGMLEDQFAKKVLAPYAGIERP